MKGKADNNAHCLKHAFSYSSQDAFCPYCRIEELERRIAISEDQDRRLSSLTTPCNAPIRERERRARRQAELARARIREAMPDIIAEMEKAKKAVQPTIDREMAQQAFGPSGEWRA